jgi:hypothetical protein
MISPLPDGAARRGPSLASRLVAADRPEPEAAIAWNGPMLQQEQVKCCVPK